ncbi:MAG: SAM-dependent chlorinase/fluorinase [Acidobacteriota bacterium]|nr:SAM-dependent chlorinase/fluorinase [Acidobacteriota bacterium]
MNSNIALLTDFGTKDYFVGAMKGAILSINERTSIIDITHEIPPQDVLFANFILRACYKDFPIKTIFVAVVDPEVGSKRKAILVETEKFSFIAPDNGLLSFVFDKEVNYRARELTNKKFFAAEVSRTFHGRDVFARVAAHLSKGINPNEFGAEIKDFIHIKTARPRKISEREIEADVIHIDHFGNLITNLKQTDLPENFTLKINGKIINKLQSFFAEAERSELFMILGSAGFLEIAAFQDSAEKLLNAQINQRVLLVT